MSARDDELRMHAYYYGFSSTGVPEIDLILSAVACAGKAYHHTESWSDDCDPYPGHTGQCPVEWIQNAANQAAEKLRACSGQTVSVTQENKNVSG